MLQRIAYLLRMTPPNLERVGLMFAHGDTVPADGTPGYETGCLFQKINGGVGTALYVNEGDYDSCDFNAVQVA